MKNVKESMYNEKRCYVYNKAFARWFDNNDAHRELNILDNAKQIIDGIGDCVVVLTNLAHLAGTSIEECIDAAYNEIKDRTGKMSNGTFKKD